MGGMASPEQEAAPPASESVTPETAPTTPTPSKPEEKKMPVEIGGPAGPEPTRFGDWERKGRVSDF